MREVRQGICRTEEFPRLAPHPRPLSHKERGKKQLARRERREKPLSLWYVHEHIHGNFRQSSPYLTLLAP